MGIHLPQAHGRQEDFFHLFAVIGMDGAAPPFFPGLDGRHPGDFLQALVGVDVVARHARPENADGGRIAEGTELLLALMQGLFPVFALSMSRTMAQLYSMPL